MKQRVAVIAAFLLAACGKPSKEGFFTDGNICRPLEPQSQAPGINGSVSIPAVAGGIRVAQLSTAVTEKKYLWGAELYLSSGLELSAKLAVTPFIKRNEFSPFEASTVGPDGGLAARPYLESIESFSATIAPQWVRVQFPSAAELLAGDAVWLVVDPSYEGEQTVALWYESGSGLYATAAASPLFVEIPGAQAVHRLIYCE